MALRSIGHMPRSLNVPKMVPQSPSTQSLEEGVREDYAEALTQVGSCL